MAHDMGTLDAQLAEERGHLRRHLVEDEPRVRMAGAESRQVDGGDLKRAGERGQVAPPPGARAGEAMEQDERRTSHPGLSGHDRAVLEPAHGIADHAGASHPRSTGSATTSFGGPQEHARPPGDRRVVHDRLIGHPAPDDVRQRLGCE